MENTTYYIPASSLSLAHYFGRAVILPSKYYESKPSDLQDSFDGNIFLTKNRWVKGADCSLQIVLNDNETKQLLTVAPGSFLYNNAIPISRIKTVFFLTLEQKNTTLWNINNGAAFLPEYLVKIDDRPSEDNINIENIKIEIKLSITDITEKAKRFDILLGGLAFMRVSKNVVLGYPKDYFSTLSYFNHTIKEQVLLGEKQGYTKFDDRLTGVFTTRKDTPWHTWQSLIYENVDKDIVEQAAAKEKLRLTTKFGLLQLNSIPINSYVYILALLATYGKDKSKGIEELINLLTEGKLSEEKAEEIALIFGLHIRYSNLRNAYGRGQDNIIKFKMESQLDYYIIESIYQFAFNNVKDNRSFDYIDGWVKKQELKWNVKQSFYVILDTLVSTKKKPQPEELFSDGFAKRLPILQRSIEEAARQVFEEIYSPIEHQHQQECSDLRDKISKLEKELMGKSITKIKVKEDLNYKSEQEHGIKEDKSAISIIDDLDTLEWKELKKIAKTKKISNSIVELIKPTKQGFDELISVIRSTNTPTLL